MSNLALATAWYRIVAYFVDAHSLKLRKKQVLFLADQNVFLIDLSDMFGVTRCLCKLFKLFNTPFFVTGLLQGTAWKMANLRLKVSIKEKNERGQEVELVCKMFQFKPQVRLYFLHEKKNRIRLIFKCQIASIASGYFLILILQSSPRVKHEFLRSSRFVVLVVM